MSTRQHYIFLCLLTGITTLSAKAQHEKNDFVIEGSVAALTVPPQIVYLRYDTILHRPEDSAAVKDGRYIFKGHIDEPVRVTLAVPADNTGNGMFTSTANMTEILIEPGVTQVVSTGTISKSVVTGSAAEKDFREADERIRLWGDSLRALFQLGMRTNNKMILSSVLSEKNLIKYKTLSKIDYPAFIRSHPASPADLLLIRRLMGFSDDANWMDTVADLYHLLPAATQTGYQGRIVGMSLDNQLKTAVGHKAADFTQQDTSGRPVSLSSFRGKYVLLSFWASWESNKHYPLLPMLRKINTLYGGKGLVVLGVSLDADRDAWLQVIREDGLGSTVEVSDLKGRDNAVATLYGLDKVPMGLLIDPHGVIVARNLNGGNIGKTLSAIFE